MSKKPRNIRAEAEELLSTLLAGNVLEVIGHKNIEAVDRYARKTGITRNEAVRQLIEKALAREEPH